jgi:hypothetical protein
MRSRIATHSHEVRSLQRYELKSIVAAQLRCAGTAVMAAAAAVLGIAQSNEKPNFDKQPERNLRVTLR